ncbi:MAG TPA: FtsX-like permease family protein [candidate division Zixibacteria bacterium]|jgi:putative ABC transport system permease protein
MRVFGLIYRNMMRHKLRTLLTIAGIGVAILAFGLLRTFISAWYAGVTQAAPDRLITRSKISITFTLPLAQKSKIERISGVEAVTHGTWFGGYYKDPKDFFAQIAFESAESFKLYPEFLVDSAALSDFTRERNAVIVGQVTMERFGWSVGDVVTLTGMIYPGQWDFVIRGAYTGRDEATDVSQFLFHWDYIDQRMAQEWPSRTGQVGWWIIKIDDPAKAAQISAAVDAEFDNSADETLTETEAAFQQSFVAMAGTIIFSLKVISFLVIGIILLVAANTMAMTARERISEYAVLKTLGFGAFHVGGLIVGESLLISALGGAFGIALMFPVLNVVGAALRAWFPAFPIDPNTYPMAAAAAIGVGILASIFPAWRALSVRIADGLRRIG